MSDRHNYQRTKDMCENLPADELSYLFGRFCGPNNRLISEKKYGFHLSSIAIKEIIFNRELEDALCGEVKPLETK